MLENHPRLKELRYTLYRIFRNPSAIIGVILLLFFICIAVFAPYIAPPKDLDRPYMMPRAGYTITPQPPNEKNIFGTTEGQYDIFYGIIWGTRTAFRIGLFVITTAVIIGVILGTLAGYFGGKVDEIIMRLVDVVFAIPFLVLAMAIVVSFGRGLDIIMIAIASIAWRSYPRVIRSAILSVREQDFVQAAKTMGVSDIRIMWRHIIPNSIYPVMVIAFMEAGSVVLTAAFMSFLGLGAPKGYSDWGQMVALARNYIVGPADDPLKFWYTIIIPGGAIVLFVLAWALIGDALRDAFDPKIRRK
ncbi:ABC transporter permease [bacterium]|nr:ABC transporter permease [bacterium]